jgi:hypothetical protein
MKAYGRVDVQIHVLLTSALVEGEWSASHPGRFTTEESWSFKLQSTVSRPFRLGVRHPSGTRDQFFFLLEILFRQLQICYFVAPSPTRGRVCNLLLLLVLASAVPGLKTIFYCLNSWDSPNLEGQVPVFISSRNRVAQIYPRHWVPFPSPLTTRRATVEVFYPASTRDTEERATGAHYIDDWVGPTAGLEDMEKDPTRTRTLATRSSSP